MAVQPGTIVGSVIAQHAEEAAFLWLLRDRSVYAPHFSLRDLAQLDDRVEAHLDGLRLAGDAGWEICQEALSQEGRGEVFAAAVLAFGNKNEPRIQEVLKIGTAAPGLSRSVASALGWLSYPQAEALIKSFLAAEAPALRHIGIVASAVHRKDPGEPLANALSADDPLLKARALRAVGELGRLDLQPLLQDHLVVEDVSCRFSATWSAALLANDAGAVTSLQQMTESDLRYREKALAMALRRMPLSAAGAWLKNLAQNPGQIRLAVIGSGIVGDPEPISWLIEQMNVPALARVAGEAFTMITGVDIVREHLDGQKPEGFEAGPTEDPADENVEMDADENLPWPNPALIRKWWNDHRGNFKNGTRYLLGQPISLDWLPQVLRTGRQRQRAAAALELAIRQPGRPLFEVRAPGFRQKQILGESK